MIMSEVYEVVIMYVWGTTPQNVMNPIGIYLTLHKICTYEV